MWYYSPLQAAVALATVPIEATAAITLGALAGAGTATLAISGSADVTLSLLTVVAYENAPVASAGRGNTPVETFTIPFTVPFFRKL